MNAALEEIAKQLGLIGGFLGALVLLWKGYRNERKAVAEEKPSKIAVVGGAGLTPEVITEGMDGLKRVADEAAKCRDLLARIAEHTETTMNMVIERDRREEEDDRDELKRLRREERERLRRSRS